MHGNFKNELLVQETLGVQKFITKSLRCPFSKTGNFTNYRITGGSHRTLKF